MCRSLALVPSAHRVSGRLRRAWPGLALLIAVAAVPALAEERGRPVPAELLGKAWTQGTVRVIVELGGAGAVPEGQLRDAPAVAAQRGRIASERRALRAALRGLRHRVLREFTTIPYVGLEVDHAALQLLDALPGLATRVHEDVRLHPTLAESAPLINAPDAWAAGWDGAGQVIAIVDTGVDGTHPFLAGKVVAEACFDSVTSACPDGSGSQVGAGAGVPCADLSVCSHGTHVAGIAAGRGGPAGVAFSGVARGASLASLRVFYVEPDASACAPRAAPCALASWMDIIAALEHALTLQASHDVVVANLSLGGGYSTTPCDDAVPDMTAAIANLRAAGVATVVASGNDGFLNALAFPACISTAISVGATKDGSGPDGTPADQVTFFSNSASFLSLLAPGQWITSSIPGGGFGTARGTSMAAPHVAGAWAAARQAMPDASVSDVLAALRNTGKPVTDVNGVTTPRIAATLVQFSAAAYSVSETAGLATITVDRVDPAFGTITVDYATSAGSAVEGQDYTETSGTLSFAPGETAKSFTVPILNDAKVDGPRTVALALTSPGGGALLGARAGAVLTIGDNDVGGSIQFSAAQYSVSESGGLATITVTRTGGAAEVSVPYATADGSALAGQHYQPAAGTLDFGAGVMSRTFTVTILPNDVADGARTVLLALDAPGGGAALGARKTAVLTIVDDEISLQFSASQYAVTEGTASATIAVTRSGPLAPAVAVAYGVLPGTATAGADFGGPITGTLAFAAGQPSRTFTVPILDDTLAEPPETVLLKLSSPTGAHLGPRSTAVLTINDNDGAGTFRFGAAAYAAREASAAVSVTISRANGSAGNGAVRLRSIDTGGGTATPGDDYAPVDQVVTFAAGQTSRTVALALSAGLNAKADGPRTVHLQLEDPTPVGLARLGAPALAVVTIADDDVAGTLQLGPASVSVPENAGTAVLTVTRTGGGAGDVGVGWEITGGTAAAGVDFADPASHTLAFGSGVTSRPLAIPLLDPPGAHGTRTIVVTLKDPTGGATLGARTATINLLDDVVGFRFGQAGYTAGEGSASATITVLRTGPATAASTVGFETGTGGTAVPGTHFTPVSGTLAFGAGQTLRTFTVPLRNNALTEPGLTVELRLKDPGSGAELGAPHDALLTITDNDPAGTFRFGAGTYTATEGAANPVVTVTVTRTGGSGGGVTVPWSVTGGSALIAESGTGVDALTPASGVLAFGPGETGKTLAVQVLDDPDPEPNETITFALGAPSPAGTVGVPAAATLVIVDDDRVGTLGFAVAAASVTEGPGVASVVVTRTGATGQAASVDWVIAGGTATRGDTTDPPADYVSPAGGTLAFAAGQASLSIPLTVLGDPDPEGDETIVLALQDPSPGWALGLASTTVTLVEGTVRFQTATPSAGEGSGSATVTVTRTGLATQPVTVQYAAGPGGTARPANPATACQAGADYRPVTGLLTFAPGQTNRTFTVPICADTLAEPGETVELALAVVSGPAILGAPATATLTIVDNDLAGALRFSSAAYGASETQATVALTVLRTSTGGGVSVDWTVVGGTAVPGVDFSGPTAGTLLFGAGQTSQSLVIPLLNDALTDGSRTLVIALSNPLPAGLATLAPPPAPTQATVTLGDNEPVLRLSAAAYGAGEGAAAAVTILRAGAPGGTPSVTLVPLATSGAIGDSCLFPGVDFAAAPISVSFAASEMAKVVLVPLCEDKRAEGPESFTVELQDALGASLGTPAAAVVTIGDDDLGGTLAWGAAQVSGLEGTTVALTVTRTGGAASDVTVSVETQDGDGDPSTADAVAGTDYPALPPTVLTFAEGVSSQTVEIPLLAPGGSGPRVFRVRLQDPTGGASLGSPATALVWTLD